MLNGRAGDIKRHKWFDGLDWDALEARKMEPPRLPKEDSAKRLRELTVRPSMYSALLCHNYCIMQRQYQCSRGGCTEQIHSVTAKRLEHLHPMDMCHVRRHVWLLY